jgi:hypothetical protein
MNFGRRLAMLAAASSLVLTSIIGVLAHVLANRQPTSDKLRRPTNQVQKHPNSHDLRTGNWKVVVRARLAGPCENL